MRATLHLLVYIGSSTSVKCLRCLFYKKYDCHIRDSLCQSHMCTIQDSIPFNVDSIQQVEFWDTSVEFLWADAMIVMLTIIVNLQLQGGAIINRYWISTLYWGLEPTCQLRSPFGKRGLFKLFTRFLKDIHWLLAHARWISHISQSTPGITEITF